jgi:hypothetical protein
MARASSLDPCLLCGCLPCECVTATRPRARKAAPSRERATPAVKETVEPSVEPDVVRQSMLARMRARAAEAPPPPVATPEPTRARPTHASSELPSLAPDDAIEVAAIRALQTGFEVSGDAVDKWKTYLEKPPGRAERVQAWKMNRGSNELVAPREGTNETPTE